MVVDLDPAAAVVLHPPLPCPIGPVCTARRINGLSPLAGRVRTSISRSSRATTPSFVVVAAVVMEEATVHPVRQTNG